MATAVFFHAHPDDEAISTGGTIAKASAAGHRTILVYGTKGEHGEVAEGFLDDGEELWQRRMQEVDAAAKVLGVQRVEFLGYRDSGMMGTPENEDPNSFWRAPLDEAAERLAAILAEEQADILTCYDENGGYGHPDHIKVHQVGVRAGELAGTPKVYEATMDRDYFRQLLKMAADMGMQEAPAGDAEDFQIGVPSHCITTRVDVSGYLDKKKDAMRAHASQITETSFFLSMPDFAFQATWGMEWFILRGGVPEGVEETDIFESL